MDVSKLPSDLQSQLRSDLVARSISNCVIELVENALDAHASCIAIRINLESFRLEVVDNGVGINKEQLELIGERYYTSKRDDHAKQSDTSKYFGHRGEGLASIKNVSSRLLIVSRARGGDTSYCKVFKGNSITVDECVYQRASRGTTVIVENLLGNLPVRQKCTKSYVELQTIKRYIQATALMFPTVNFGVRDDAKKSDVLKVERTNSSTSTFSTLFPGAIKERSSMQKLVSKCENITIKAMISKEPCHTDELQFVFINKRYIPNSEIQTYLNQLLYKRTAPKPVYALNLSCPREEYHIMFEAGKRLVEFKKWSKVKKCLFELVKPIVKDECVLVDEAIPEKKETRGFASKEAFQKLNTAHTVFGLTANRKKNETEVYIIEDSSSNSNHSVSLLKNSSPKRFNLRVKEKVKVSNKKQRNVKKNPKVRTKSPRLTDQGASLTYTKSPIKKLKPSKDPKTCSESIDGLVNESNSNEYAWIWNLPTKKPSKQDEKPKEQTEEKTEGCRVPKKDKKSQNTNKNVKSMERYKSMEALSRRQMSQKPGQGRISKKCNNYFEHNPLERKDLIFKYGNVKKNSTQRTTTDKVRLTDLEAEKIWDFDVFEHHQNQDEPEIPQTMIFNNQSSPELECFNDNAVEFDVRSKRNPGENFELIPTLSWVDDDSKKSKQPLKKVSKRLNFDEFDEKRPSEPFKFKNSDRLDHHETMDYKRKVSEWISKMPPAENMEIENPLTPTNHVTNEIVDEFETKAKITKNLNDDTTPKKSELKFDNFKPDWKPNLNKSRIQKYMIQSKVRHRSKNQSPKLLFKWNPKASVDRSYIDEILRTGDQKENYTQHSNENETSTGLKPIEKNMSWNCVNDCVAVNPSKINDSNEMNDVLNDIQNVVDSSQKSSCPSDCQCKCHKKESRSRKIISTDPLKNGAHDSAESVYKDTVILSDSNPDQRNDISQLVETVNVNTKEKENLVEPETSNQHSVACSENPENSKYFSSQAKLVEKLKFKLTSSAIDIPKEMLELQMAGTNVGKLSDQEKKAVGELVKPFSMQNDITVDDYGNSCLRIFPFLKKNVQVLENPEEDLNCAVTFTKSDLSSFQFMAQIENKFILAKAFVQSIEAPVLILLDQHAVDERIRVERLFKDYTKDLRWLSTAINPPIHLSIPFNYSSLFTDYQSNFEEFGLFYEFNNVMENNKEKLLVSFTKVPTCFYNKAMRERNSFHLILKRLIESLVKEMLTKFRTQGTLVHPIPNELQEVVNDEACRGAVKFGDKLSSQVCVALLEGLKFCNLPFQCAHGRPCLTPLVNLQILKQFQKGIAELSLGMIEKSVG